MIYLWSATPGTGKTCYVVKQLVDKWTVDDKYKHRKIYHNINGLKIEGLHQAPDDFRQCDDGSIIIYDEAQDIDYYSVESKINPVCKELSKHRHRGFDIHFITQDPALLNKWVLKNVYMHYYFWRPAQRKNIEIYTFPRAIVIPTKQDFKTAFDKKLWRFEEHYLQYYKSTVMNTSEKVGSSKRASIIATGFMFLCVIAYFIQPLFSIANNFEAKDQAQDNTDNTTAQNTSKVKQPTDTAPTTQDIRLQEQEQLIANQKRKIELYQKMLPKDYEVIKSDPNLQVRGVIHSKKGCSAYNTNGDLMNLSADDCAYYISEPGRVHKPLDKDKNLAYDSVQATPSQDS